MVYYSRRQCSNPDDCADGQTPSPTVERVLHTIHRHESAPDDHKLLRAYIVLALNLILFAVLARAGYRALTRPRAAPATKHHRRNSSLTMGSAAAVPERTALAALSSKLHYSGVSRKGLFSKAIRLGLYTCILYIYVYTYIYGIAAACCYAVRAELTI